MTSYTIAHTAPESILLLMEYNNLHPEKAAHTGGFHLVHIYKAMKLKQMATHDYDSLQNGTCLSIYPAVTLVTSMRKSSKNSGIRLMFCLVKVKRQQNFITYIVTFVIAYIMSTP